MKTFPSLRALLAAGLSLFLTAAAQAAQEVHPGGGPPGSWRVIATTHADYSGDHDTIVVKGNDNVRRLKFKVTNAPLNLHRMVVTYDNGEPDKIDVREEIPQGGESRVIDLPGGSRSLKKIEFWYDTKGKG